MPSVHSLDTMIHLPPHERRPDAEVIAPNLDANDCPAVNALAGEKYGARVVAIAQHAAKFNAMANNGSESIAYFVPLPGAGLNQRDVAACRAQCEENSRPSAKHPSIQIC